MAVTDASDALISLAPTKELDAKKTFGIELDWKVPAFAERTPYAPDIDPAYRFDPQTTRAILAGFMLLSGGAAFASFGQMALTAQSAPHAIVLLAFALTFFGFGSKAGLWPFHLWLPEAHPQAPSHISALMSGVMLKMALYGFLRLLLSVFPPIPSAWTLPVIALGLLSAVFGALYAIIERDFKRLLVVAIHD